MNTRQFTLPPELWFRVLSFLSKRDLYTCYFVSTWINELAHLNQLYSKAPGPWPKRNYRLFKDAQQAKAKPPNSNGKAFEKNDVLFNGIHRPKIDEYNIEIMHALYTAYCKHKYKNLSDEAIKQIIPTFPHDYPKFHTGASPQYVIAELNKKCYLLNAKTLQACYLGNKNHLIKAACLSNNDIYIIKENKKLKLHEIYYNWSEERNEFDTIFDFPFDPANKYALFHADQLITSIKILSASSTLKIGLFDFNKSKHRYIEVKQGQDAGCFQGAYYFVFPLDENHLIGFGNKYPHHLPAQPLWIWDNKTGELVYSKSFADLTEYQVNELDDGNLRVTYGPYVESKLTLRFGFFNKFDEPAQKISVSSQLACPKK